MSTLQAGNTEEIDNTKINPQIADKMIPQEAAPEQTLQPQGLNAEQLLGLLNKAMDKIGSSEKNPLEMLTALKKLRKEI